MLFVLVYETWYLKWQLKELIVVGTLQLKEISLCTSDWAPSMCNIQIFSLFLHTSDFGSVHWTVGMNEWMWAHWLKM